MCMLGIKDRMKRGKSMIQQQNLETLWRTVAAHYIYHTAKLHLFIGLYEGLKVAS